MTLVQGRMATHIGGWKPSSSQSLLAQKLTKGYFALITGRIYHSRMVSAYGQTSVDRYAYTPELGSTQILKMVWLFIKHHGITNYHGIWLAQVNTSHIQ